MAKTLFDTKIDIVDLEFPNKGVGIVYNPIK
jgi:hypothetical protein